MLQILSKFYEKTCLSKIYIQLTFTGYRFGLGSPVLLLSIRSSLRLANLIIIGLIRMTHPFIIEHLFIFQNFSSQIFRSQAIVKLLVCVIVEFVLLVDVVFVALLPAVELESAFVRLLCIRRN